MARGRSGGTGRRRILVGALPLLLLIVPSAPVAAAAAATVPAPPVTAPGVTAPEVSAPEVSAPEVSAPEVSAPEVSAPEVSAPATAATLVRLTPTSDPTRSRAPSWQVLPAAGVQATCALDDGPESPCAGLWTGRLMQDAPDGPHTLRVNGRSPGGLATMTTTTWVLDTTPPPAPDVAATWEGAAAGWAFSVEPGATGRCTLLRDGRTVAAAHSCTSPVRYLLPPQHGWALEVAARDDAGNVGATTTSPAVLADLPVAPPVLRAPVHGSTTVWTVATAPAATCELLDPAGAVERRFTCNNSAEVDLSDRPDGVYRLHVQTPPVGQVSHTYVLDREPPAAPEPTGSLLGRVATWWWEGDPDGESACRLSRDGVDGAERPCTSGQQWPLPGDGRYRLVVRAQDRAGNTSTPGRSPELALDNTPPAAPEISGPVGPGTDRSPAFRLLAEPGATLACRVQRGGLVLHDWRACSDPHPLGLDVGDGDGTYVLQALATDASGNESAVTSSGSYLLDVTPPTRPSVHGASAPGRASGAGWTWDGEPGSTSRCRLHRDGMAAGEPERCSAGTSPDLPGDGTYQLEVVLRDPAGNLSEAGWSPEYRYDTTAPLPPRVSPSAAGGADRRPSVTIDTEPGTSLACRVGGESWQPCTGPYVPELTSAPDGLVRLEVVATDEAGNRSAVGSADYRLDTSAPAAPQVTAVVARGQEPVATFDLQAPTEASVRCRLAGPGQPSGWSPCAGSTAYTLTGLADGAYVLSAVAEDAEGNAGPAGSATYVLDTRPPAPVVVTGSPASPGAVVLPSWTWTAEPGTESTCLLTGPGRPVAEPCAGRFTADLHDQPDGRWTLTITSTDSAGGTTTDQQTYDLDRSQPDLALGPPPADAGRTPTWTVQAPHGARCVLLEDGREVVPERSCADTYRADLTDEPDGSYELVAHVGGGRARATYTLDRVAPGLRLQPAARLSAEASPVVLLSADEPVREARCRVLPVSDWSPCDVTAGGSPFRVPLADQPDGSYRVEVQATDLAGNPAEAAVEQVRDTSAPAVASVDAPTGPSAERHPSWRVRSPESGSSLDCALTGPSGDQEPVDCGGAAFSTGPLGMNGTYVLSVVVVDPAGNRSAPVTSAYLLDTDAPEVGEPVPGQGPVTSARAARWTVSPEPGSRLHCRLLLGDQELLARQECTSPYTAVLDGPDGRYRLVVDAVDAAGNVSAAREGGVVLDTSAPGRPVVRSRPGSPGSSPLVAWEVEPEPSTALLCQLLRSGRAIEEPRPCDGTEQVDLTAMGESRGVYALRTWARDGAGNLSDATDTARYVLDPAGAPSLSWTGPVDAHLAGVDAPWGFTSAPGVATTCRVLRDGVPLSRAQPCVGSAPLTGVERTGRYTLQVWQRAAGQQNAAPAERTVDLDLEDPLAPQVHMQPGSGPTVAWTWSAEPGTRVDCRLRPLADAEPAWADCTALAGGATVVAPAQGDYQAEVRVVDAAGRTSPVARSVVHRYDSTAPDPPTVTVSSTSDPTLTWSFSVPPDTVAGCTLTHDGAAVARHEECPGVVELDVADAAPGRYRLGVVLTDAAGNDSVGGADARVLGPDSGPTPSRIVLDDPATVPALPPDPSPVVRPAADPGAAPATAPAAGPVGLAAGPVTARAASRLVLVAPAPTELVPARRPAVLSAGAGEPSGPGTRPSALGPVLTGPLTDPTLPGAVLAVVLLFLLLHDRLDRRDPKLVAPVEPEPDLEFGPVHRLPS